MTNAATETKASETAASVDYSTIAANERATVAEIKTALRARSGKVWSVTQRASGWLTITVPPKRMVDGYITDAECAELAKLLALNYVSRQGVLLPASTAHRREYLQRAHGITPTEIAHAYWD